MSLRDQVAEVITDLALMRTRSTAVAYFSRLNPPKSLLVALANHLHVAVYTNDNKATIQRKIIDATAGVREDAAATRSRLWLWR